VIEHDLARQRRIGDRVRIDCPQRIRQLHLHEALVIRLGHRNASPVSAAATSHTPHRDMKIPPGPTSMVAITITATIALPTSNSFCLFTATSVAPHVLQSFDVEKSN
jgi:hypothetical protein